MILFLIAFLIISVAKQDYRHLIRIFPEIQVVRAAKEFKLNPLKPPRGVAAREWMGNFIDDYSHLIEVMIRSRSVLVDVVDELYTMFGIYKGGTEYPNLRDLEDLLFEKMKRPGFRTDDFLLRNYQRCHMLNTMTDIFDCRDGSDLELLLQTPAVLELDGLPNDVINFVMVHLLTWILKHRLVSGQRGRLHHVTIIDECKRVLPREELNIQSGISPISLLISYAREFGEGLVVADQEISKLSKSLVACTNTKISLFTSGLDLAEIKKTFNLSDGQMDALSELPAGTGILKLEEA